jgi:hypothetical protein
MTFRKLPGRAGAGGGHGGVGRGGESRGECSPCVFSAWLLSLPLAQGSHPAYIPATHQHLPPYSSPPQQLHGRREMLSPGAPGARLGRCMQEGNASSAEALPSPVLLPSHGHAHAHLPGSHTELWTAARLIGGGHARDCISCRPPPSRVSQQAYWTRSGATNPFAASLPLCTMLVLCKGHPLHVGPRHSHLTGSCGWVQIASRGQIGAAAESAPARGQSEHSPGPQRPGSPRGHPASSSLVSGPAQGHRNAEHHALLVGAGLGARLGGQVWGWDRRGTQKEGWVRHLNSSSGRCRTGVNQISRPSEVPLALYRVDRGASPRES